MEKRPPIKKLKKISNEIFLNISQNCWKYHDQIYIPKKYCVIFIKEFYSISIYKHQRIVKTYKKFKRHFDFSRAKTVIIIVVKDCKVYIKIKVSQYKFYKKLQILFIFERI